jgi:hypothetical protein
MSAGARRATSGIRNVALIVGTVMDSIGTLLETFRVGVQAVFPDADLHARICAGP